MPARKTAVSTTEATIKVGDTYDLGRASAYVRTPDGTTITARAAYTFRVPGEHAIVDPDDGTETTVDVAEAGDTTDGDDV